MPRRRLALLALASLAPLAAAGEPVQTEQDLGAAAGSSGDWAVLDREIEFLDAARQREEGGPVVWGFLRTNYTHADEADIDGFFLDNVRLYLDGAVGGSDYRVSLDGQSGSATLQDAYARWDFGEELHATFGRFRQPFLTSGLVEFNRLLMIVRTRSGTLHSVRDTGAMIGGHHGRVHWDLALQNGLDSVADEYLTTGRVRVDVVGEPLPAWEGAFSGTDETRLSVGLAYADDGALTDGAALAFEAQLVHGRFGLAAELVDYDDGYEIPPSIPGTVFSGQAVGGTTPYAITASYLLVPDEYELALRWEDYDDHGAPADADPDTLDFDRTRWTLGVNRYVAGHDLKWQLNYQVATNDGADDGPDEQFLSLGLSLTF